VTLCDLCRVSVVGTTGVGKTTVARTLAAKCSIPHVEVDALYWGPNWRPVPPDVFRDRIARVVAQDEWVLDGNFIVVRELVWQRVDTVIWLDYKLSTILCQLAGRTFSRVLGREVLWSGNQESFFETLLSRDSIILYAFRTYRRRRRTYSALTCDPRYRAIRFVRLRSPQETQDWLDSLNQCLGDGLY